MISVSSGPRFSPGSTTIDHDRGLIVRWLGVDLTANPYENRVWRSWSWFRSKCSTIAARSRRDRGSIGPRSWSSSTCPHNRPMAIRRSWLRIIAAVGCISNSSILCRLGDLRVDTWCEVSRPIEAWCLLAMPRVTHPPLHLNRDWRTCWIDDRVDSAPRDRSRPWGDRTIVARPRHLQGKTVWEHSPTRKKYKGRTRLNRGEDSPINCPIISSLLRDMWRPTRAPTWPRGLPATWRASYVGHTRPATWPQRHVVTARRTRVPRGSARHVSPAWARSPRQPQVISPPFSRF